MHPKRQSDRCSLDTLAQAFHGDVCPVVPNCEGTLQAGTYKGNPALVCESCGTPATLVWTD